MRVRPAEAADGTDAPDAVRPGGPVARTLVRVTLITLCGALSLAALAMFAYALAAARVPQHRATLENLVHAETGLDVRFSELSLRWGWYGPEAVFRAVELREPGEAQLLLAAPELVVGVDLWRMLRSGDLGVSRITLVDPDIDLSRTPPARALQAVRVRPSVTPARLLSRWRGTRIDVEGGTLRVGSADAPLALGIRRMQLKRSGTEWGAEALFTLPESLGTTVHARARLHGEVAQAADLTGTLTVVGSRLQLAGWRTLFKFAPGAEFLPGEGSADATVQIELSHGTLVSAGGSVEAASLAWSGAGGPAADSALERLRAEWQLVRGSAGWHLSVEPLELGEARSPGAALAIDAAADGASVRGRVQGAPLAALAGLARGCVPQLRLSGLELAGVVREASFEWNAARPPDARLRTTAEIRDLSIAPAGDTFRLEGLTARVSGVGRSIGAQLRATDARLTLAADPAFALGSIGLNAQIALEDSGRAWRVSSRDLEIRQADARLALSATLTGEDSGARPRLEARASLSGVPVELVRAALGRAALASLGTAAGELTTGLIEHAQLVARGPLDEPLPWSGPRREFSGSLTLSGASLAAAEDWPDLHGLDAHIDWRAARVRVRVHHATAVGFRLAAARGEWDAHDAGLTRLSGRLTGHAEEALAWLRDHPELLPQAAGIGSVGLSGETLLDFDLRRVASPGATRAAGYSTRFTALLEGARLRPVAGLPEIEALHGTLAFADGHLQRSTVTGQWLGGPISLSVGERRERGAGALVISGRGLLSVPQAVTAATGVSGAQSPLQGNAEWSADFKLLAAPGGQHSSWRARGDSNLAGVTSRLPEPFAKTGSSMLPAHVELIGTDDTAELRLALGERLRGLVAVKRRGDLWQIERGAVNFAASAPALPAAPIVRVEGTVSRLDLPGYTALWRELAHNPAWPALRVELTASELLAANRSFADVHLSADAAANVDRLRLESADLDGQVRWPAVVDAAHPVIARLERLDLTGLAGTRAGAGLIAALGPVTQLAIGDLAWQGRSLGAFAATFATRADGLEVSDVRLGGAGDESRGALSCGADLCRASFSLDSRDAAATLTRLGFRADLTASRAVANGEFAWPVQGAAELAAVRGRLHIELDEGVARGAAGAAPEGSPLGLFAVPGLIAGMGLPQLRFARLTADFAVADGQAVTSDLHLDGDAEILMRGRIGLLAHDYDAQGWVLKGEERLPAAVRGLSPGPRVAALWMSLRELFAGANRERAPLRLHGTWDDPMVTAGN
jgi:uncharacterized protein YhdP